MNAVNKPQSLASIKFLKGPLTGITFQIDKPVTTIGRDPGNDIVIDEDLHVAGHVADGANFLVEGDEVAGRGEGHSAAVEFRLVFAGRERQNVRRGGRDGANGPQESWVRRL